MKKFSAYSCFFWMAGASSKGITLSAFVLASLLVGGQHARAELDSEFVKVDGTKYCVGFDNDVKFIWPGKGGGKGNGLFPGEKKSDDDEYAMGKWQYDDQDWWNGYTEANKNTGSSNAKLAKKLSQKIANTFFVWTTGSGNQPNGYIEGTNKAGYLENSALSPGAYNYFQSDNFIKAKDLHVAYKCNIEPNIPDGDLGYKLSDVSDGVVNPIFGGGTLLVDKGGISGQDFLVNDVDGNAIDNSGNSIEFSGVFSGEGGLKFRGSSTTLLSGHNTYKGKTEIESGVLTVTGSLSDVTAVSVNQGAQYNVASTDTVGSIEGAGEIQIFENKILMAGGLNTDTTFSGKIRGSGGFTKVGTGTTTFSGDNTYKGDTTIASGTLMLGSSAGLDKQSFTLVTGTGHLDLASFDGDGIEIDDITMQDKGKLSVTAKNPLKVSQFAMNGGEIDAYVFDKVSDGPIQVQKDGKFVYKEGTLNVLVDSSDVDPEGTWNIIDGEVTNEKQLAANTFLEVNDEEYSFEGIGEENAVVGASAVYQGYLEKGSLKFVVELKKDLIPDAGGENPDTGGKDPDADGDGELDQLPGCELGDDLCDIISDIDGDEDDARDEEEEVASEIIDGLLDGLEDEEIDLAFGFDYGQLAMLVGSGLAPRNVDAAGRGMSLHNIVLVDALFERQPLRQFEELLLSYEVVEETVIEEEATVEGAVADAAVAIEVEEAAVIELDDVSLVDQQDDELDLAKRDGVSAWVKGYGGNSRADDSSILYNDYDLDAYGTSFGVDVALSETFQIGAFANYGDVNLQHRSGDIGGGSWNPEGWGGGLTAQYSARNFYVQGLLGASEFSGEQSRNILQINEQFGGNTARGDKTVTSYLGALRLGAPFKTGGVVLEPQAQALWTHNREHGFSETSGSEKNLRLKYKDRTTNFMETELGMKLSVPIRTGERGLLVPSVRAAWLADWNRENEGQEIGYKFTKKTATFDSELETQNGALIEAGLDYTIQNFNSTSVKVYARGGMELWNSDRGTTWRGSGGVTFQF